MEGSAGSLSNSQFRLLGGRHRRKDARVAQGGLHVADFRGRGGVARRGLRLAAGSLGRGQGGGARALSRGGGEAAAAGGRGGDCGGDGGGAAEQDRVRDGRPGGRVVRVGGSHWAWPDEPDD